MSKVLRSIAKKQPLKQTETALNREADLLLPVRTCLITWAVEHCSSLINPQQHTHRHLHVHMHVHIHIHTNIQ